MNHFLLCTVAVLVNTCFLTADTIHLVNGDRLSGEIQSLASAKFTFQTAYAGTLEIAWDQIQTLSAVSPLIVEMDGGVSARGLLSSPEPGTLQIDSNSPIPFAQVVAIYKDANIPDAPRFLESWNGSANLGFTLVRGNTTIDNFTFNFTPANRCRPDKNPGTILVQRPGRRRSIEHAFSTRPLRPVPRFPCLLFHSRACRNRQEGKTGPSHQRGGRIWPGVRAGSDDSTFPFRRVHVSAGEL